MLCSKCGYLYDDTETNCPKCGNPSFEQNVEENLVPLTTAPSALQKLVDAFRDPLFLTFCILTTVSALSMDVFSILFAVFSWLIYAKTQKNTCDIKSMRCISGTIFAELVINWVVVGFLAVAALLCIAAGSMIDALSNIDLINNFVVLIGDFGRIIISVAIIIMIAVYAVLNIWIYKPMHNFAKSLYQGAYANEIVLNRLNYVSNAILVLGILKGIYALSFIGSFSFIINGSSAAKLIIIYLWLKKYFTEPKTVNF